MNTQISYERLFFAMLTAAMCKKGKYGTINIHTNSYSTEITLLCRHSWNGKVRDSFFLGRKSVEIHSESNEIPFRFVGKYVTLLHLLLYLVKQDDDEWWDLQAFLSSSRTKISLLCCERHCEWLDLIPNSKSKNEWKARAFVSRVVI